MPNFCSHLLSHMPCRDSKLAPRHMFVFVTNEIVQDWLVFYLRAVSVLGLCYWLSCASVAVESSVCYDDTKFTSLLY